VISATMLTLEVSRDSWITGSGIGDDPLARGGGFQQKIVADGFKAGGVGEDGQLNLADILRLDLAVQLHQHFAVRIHGDVDRVLRDGDAGHHHIAVGRHDLTLSIELHGARAGVGGLAVGQLHLEIAMPVDGHVQHIAGRIDGALLIDAIDGGRLDAGADLHARRHHGARIGGGGADAAEILIQKIAMLFEMTSTFSCWASMPVAPMLKLRMEWPSLLDAGELADCGPHALVFAVDEFLS